MICEKWESPNGDDGPRGAPADLTVLEIHVAADER
jgi:hypothetical protein